MFNHKEFRNAVFAQKLGYLSADDRYFTPENRQPQFSIAIIGCGVIGQEHMFVTALEGRCRVHGVYDSNSASVKYALAHHTTYCTDAPRVYRSLQEAVSDSAVDGYIIATPNHTHLAVLQEVIASNKPILLEKPMATTIADAYQIYQIANSYSSWIQVGLQYRYKAIYQEAHLNIIKQSRIGDVKTIQIMEHRLPFLDKVNQWNKFSKLSGGTLVEKCCHYFDLFNYFAQSKPVQVSAYGSQAVNYQDFEYNGELSDIVDHADVTVQYENGVQAHFNLCMFAPMFSEQLVVCGTEGRLKAEESEDFLPGTSTKTSLEIKSSTSLPSVWSEPHHHSIIEQSGHNGGTYFEHYYFTEHLLGHTVTTATPHEGLWSIVIGVAAELSLKRQQPIYTHDLMAQFDL